MRLLATVENPDAIKQFCQYLDQNHIKYELDIQTNTNWGDEQYGIQTYRLWIIDEEAFDLAWNAWGEFKENPTAEQFLVSSSSKKSKESVNSEEEEARRQKFKKEKIIPLLPDPIVIPKKPAKITRWMILLCCIFFFLETVTSKTLPYPEGALYVSSPITREMLFDFPKAAEIYTKVKTVWGQKSEEEMPSDARVLLKKAEETPVWRGFYDRLVQKIRGVQTEWINAPLFEKIRQGEIWRLVTPIFLHGGLLHILFNMMWIWMLGVEIERTLKPQRYLTLILVLAVISSVCQYLMSGYNFVGISGVVSGMVFFIAQRQKNAPWEGYTLQHSVYIFLMVYVFGLAAVQCLSFLLEIAGFNGLPSSIGNTAHVTGAIAGYLLGKTSLFAWKE